MAKPNKKTPPSAQTMFAETLAARLEHAAQDEQFSLQTLSEAAAHCSKAHQLLRDALLAHIAARTKTPDPAGRFVVHVDGMDGEVHADWIAATCAVTHAFRHGAKSVTLQKYKDEQAKKPAAAKGRKRAKKQRDA